MDTKPYSLQAPEDIAKEYGGNKQAIARAAQSGLVDPTAAVLAGMFIDRMRNAAAQEQIPQQTVAQQVLSPQPQQAPVGLGATPAAQAMPAPTQMGAPPAMAGGGLADLPVDESMFPDEYAGGGIVAFGKGDLVGTFDSFGPGEAQYDEFSSYQPLFPSVGEGNRRYALKQLGYTNEQISKMSPAQQEFVLRNVQKAPASTATATPTAQPPAAAPAQPPLRDFKDTDTGVNLTGLRQPAEYKTPSIEDYKDLQAKFGVSDKAEKTIQGIIDKLSGEGKGDRELAKNMALAQAGFAIMGGTSPYALTNIGKGAMEGISQYGKDIKDIKAAEREISKLQIAQANAEDARARGDLKGYQDYVDKAQDHALKLRKLGVDERVADAQIKYYGRPGTYEELGQAAEKYPWLKERFTAGAETAEATRAKTALAGIENALLTMKKDDPRRKELERQRAAILERLTSMGGAGGAGGSSADPLGLRGGR